MKQKFILAIVLCTSFFLIACSSPDFDASKFKSNGLSITYDKDLPTDYTYLIDDQTVAELDGRYLKWSEVLEDGDHTLTIKDDDNIVFEYKFNWTNPETDGLFGNWYYVNDTFILALDKSAESKDVQVTINDVAVTPKEAWVNGDGYYCLVFDSDVVDLGTDTNITITCDGKTSVHTIVVGPEPEEALNE